MIEWTLRAIQSLGYPGLVCLMVLENVFPPIPSEVILPFAGFLSTTGALSSAGVVAAATAGSLLGALTLYALGALFGRERLYRFVGRYGRYFKVDEKDVLKAERWFHRYGPGAVFFGRMFPVVRSLISVPAGLARMRMPAFVLYTVAGTTLWNLFLVSAGAALGAAWATVARWIDYYQLLALGLLALVVSGVLYLRARRRSS